MKKQVLAAAALAMLVSAAHAADGTVKIGFVNTFSGPNAALGNDERDGFELALDHLGRKMGASLSTSPTRTIR
jgi:branched-chain amino acid transport system substrate-binding protein